MMPGMDVYLWIYCGNAGLLQNMQSCMGNVVAVDENVMYREKESDRMYCVRSVFIWISSLCCDPYSHCKHYSCVGGNIYIYSHFHQKKKNSYIFHGKI
jgi:hypothetical protein